MLRLGLNRDEFMNMHEDFAGIHVAYTDQNESQNPHEYMIKHIQNCLLVSNLRSSFEVS